MVTLVESLEERMSFRRRHVHLGERYRLLGEPEGDRIVRRIRYRHAIVLGVIPEMPDRDVEAPLRKRVKDQAAEGVRPRDAAKAEDRDFGAGNWSARRINDDAVQDSVLRVDRSGAKGEQTDQPTGSESGERRRGVTFSLRDWETNRFKI
jgi:hypothetical protein